MAKHDIPDPLDGDVNWSDDPRWCAVMGKMIDLSKQVPPDEHWLIGCAQNLAAIVVDLEERSALSNEDRAVIYGVGATLIHAGQGEMDALFQAMIGLGQIKPIYRGGARG